MNTEYKDTHKDDQSPQFVVRSRAILWSSTICNTLGHSSYEREAAYKRTRPRVAWIFSRFYDRAPRSKRNPCRGFTRCLHDLAVSSAHAGLPSLGTWSKVSLALMLRPVVHSHREVTSSSSTGNVVSTKFPCLRVSRLCLVSILCLRRRWRQRHRCPSCSVSFPGCLTLTPHRLFLLLCSSCTYAVCWVPSRSVRRCSSPGRSFWSSFPWRRRDERATRTEEEKVASGEEEGR